MMLKAYYYISFVVDLSLISSNWGTEEKILSSDTIHFQITDLNLSKVPEATAEVEPDNHTD